MSSVRNLQRAFWSEMASACAVEFGIPRCDGGTAVWSLGLRVEWVMGKKGRGQGGQLKEVALLDLSMGDKDWLKFLQPNKKQ